MCSKEQSFAGFWYEAVVFKHYRVSSKSKLDISCVTFEGNKQKELKIGISKIDELVPNSSPEQNTLYELRSSHPIVDALGCFMVKNVKRLVFIQVSLKRYENHHSLCDFFKRAPKNFLVNKNVSVFTHYRRLFDQWSNVLLVYVSPKNTNIDSMSLLHQQISKLNRAELKRKLWYGVLSRHSSFMTETLSSSFFK